MPPTTDLTTCTAVAYLRVSDEEQAGEKQTSLAQQRAAIAALAAKLGVTVGHVFEDAGFSGATMEHRPAMRALIASCDAHPRHPDRAQGIGYVLVLNDSRWGRFEQSEESTYWRVHVEKRGWRVRFAEQDDVQDDTVRPVLRAIAQSQATLYRKTLQANVRRGARGTAEQGYWQAKAPFGYLRRVVYPADRARDLANNVPKATDEKLVLAPHPAEAPIVQALFARYVQGGESLTSLLEWATRTYPSRRWTRTALHRLLKNPAYMGDVVWGRVAVEPGRRGRRPTAEWYGKPDAHPSLVTREMFAAAARRIATNRQQTRGVRLDWILTGIVHCPCGRNYTGAGNTGPRGAGSVYACSSRGAHPSRRCAYPGTVRKQQLEAATLDVLAKEIGSAVHRRAMTAAIDRVLAEARASVRTVDAIDRELAGVRQRQHRLLAAIENGVRPSDVADRLTVLRHDTEQLRRERDAVALATGEPASTAWRDALVTRALDFRTMAATLTGPALRELVQLWLKTATFDPSTRELTMEIRRVPAGVSGLPSPAAALFVAEGEPSRTKGSRRNPLEATITRRVIIGRRRVA